MDEKDEPLTKEIRGDSDLPAPARWFMRFGLTVAGGFFICFVIGLFSPSLGLGAFGGLVMAFGCFCGFMARHVKTIVSDFLFLAGLIALLWFFSYDLAALGVMSSFVMGLIMFTIIPNRPPSLVAFLRVWQEERKKAKNKND